MSKNSADSGPTKTNVNEDGQYYFWLGKDGESVVEGIVSDRKFKEREGSCSCKRTTPSAP